MTTRLHIEVEVEDGTPVWDVLDAVYHVPGVQTVVNNRRQ